MSVLEAFLLGLILGVGLTLGFLALIGFSDEQDEL